MSEIKANPAQKNAQSYFSKTQQSETTAKQLRRKEKTADAAKTARLRELRLAKEAAEKDAAGEQAGQATAIATPRAKRTTKRMVRMSY